MKTTCGNNVQDTSASMLSIIGGYINDRYKEIRQRLKHCLVRTGRLDYVVSVSSEDIVLPDDVADVVSVLDKTNLVRLEEVSPQDWINRNYSAIDTAGTVDSYTVYDSVVRTQPSSAGVVTIVSTSTADTTQTIYVNGINSTGVQVDDTITLNGTTTATGTVSFSRILGISKSAVTVGTVTVSRGTDVLAYFSPDRTTHYCKIMRFGASPSSAFTCEIIYNQKQLPLKNDYDYPLFDCCDALEAGATADAWRYKRMNAKAADWESIYEKRVANLAFDLEASPNRVNMFTPITYSREIV